MMTNPPIIGITTTHFQQKDPLPGSGVSEAYIRAVHEAGGLPLLIPSGMKTGELEALVARLDGILFTGGGDIDPRYFNGKPHNRVYNIIPERDETEINLVRMAASGGLPFLGICRGIQMINVALGGTLYTDIADQLPGAIKHDFKERKYLAHPVQVLEGSRLARILGMTGLQANSLHHQGLEKVAVSLTPVAWSVDGLVEAVEKPGHPFGLAVQWHPEWLQELQEMRSLFTAFVAAAREK
jgi:putative glutamine amidotransferase